LIDQDLASEARERGCPACGGRLHRADYPRKPRGAPDGLGADFERRLSFCCGSEGCRKRLTPPSVRFLGRRVWLAVVVTLACVATQGVIAKRARRLREELGVDRRTLERWRRWWREELPATSGWQALRGSLRGEVKVDELPRSLFERFAGSVNEKLVLLVRFIAPLNGFDITERRTSMAT
jgi:hypothetical protein